MIRLNSQSTLHFFRLKKKEKKRQKTLKLTYEDQSPLPKVIKEWVESVRVNLAQSNDYQKIE